MTLLRDAFSLHSGVWDPSHRFETSWCLPPYVLFAIRATFSLYIFTTIFFILAFKCTHEEYGGCEGSGNTFSYFTHLTYWGLGFYFLFASLHTFTYARYGKPLLDRWPRLLKALHAFLYTTVVTYPFIVTAVYWKLLGDSTTFATMYNSWTNISQHAMNSGFALFEIVLTRTDTMKWVHIVYLIVVLALYLSLAYITKATKGFYTYSFLDASGGSGKVAAYIIGILVTAVIVFLLVQGIIWVRKWLTERKMGLEGNFRKQSSWGSDAAALNGDVEMK